MLKSVVKKTIRGSLGSVGIAFQTAPDPLGSPFIQNHSQYVLRKQNGKLPLVERSARKGVPDDSVIDNIYDFYASLDPFYSMQRVPAPLKISGAWRGLLEKTRPNQIRYIANGNKAAYKELLSGLFDNELMTGLRNFSMPVEGEAVDYNFWVECDAFERLSDRPLADMAVSDAFSMIGLPTGKGIVRYTDPQHAMQATHLLRLLDLTCEAGKPATILDLGSGFGGLAEKLAAWADRPLTILLCDIPLNITTAYAFLAGSFGTDKAHLVKTEEELLALPKTSSSLRFICVPTIYAEACAKHFSYHAMHNGKSFSEMDQETVDFYIETFVKAGLDWLLHTNSNRAGSENFGGHQEVISRNIRIPPTHKLVSRFADSRPGRYVLSIYTNKF